MTRLTDLHRQLSSLRRRRRRVRWATAWAGAVVALLVALAAAFALDWVFEMTRPQRGLLLVLCAAGLFWAVRRYSWPYLGQRESERQLAILVERAHQIDSDLVAALDFEQPEAKRWGSVELEEAVIDQASRLTGRLDIGRGVSTETLRGRLRFLAMAAAVWLAAVIIAPGHVAVFFNRVMLGVRHYPTRTTIELIKVGEVEIDPERPGLKPVRVFFGEPVKFQVYCAPRHVPTEAGRVELIGRRSGLRTTLLLEPRDEGSRVFEAQWARPAEDAAFQVFLDDAWTDPGLLSVAAPPVVELRAEVIPPLYAGKGDDRLRLPPGLLQFSVVEGSQVALELTSDHRLESAELTVGDRRWPFRELSDRPDEQGRFCYRWEDLDSPLGSVVELTRFSVQVTDTEGQRLERPLEGLVRIQADQPPRVAAAAVTRFVLPTARPQVLYRAIDDYGIASLEAVVEVLRSSGETEETEKMVYQLPADAKPEKNIEGSLPLQLDELGGGDRRGLRKGDQVKLTLRATDYRGRRPGKSALCEPLVFEITDEQGILANMMEADRHSAQQLRVMIERQLGIGESP